MTHNLIVRKVNLAECLSYVSLELAKALDWFFVSKTSL